MNSGTRTRRRAGQVRPRLFLLFFTFGSLLSGAHGADAQESCFSGRVDQPIECGFEAPRWAGELASLSANGLLSGLTGGLVQHFRGGSFQDGFARGVMGGTIVYAGKRIASERFSGAGLVGRGVAAIGASTVRNAGAAVPSFSRLTFPLGPLWLDVDTPTWDFRVRVDPAALVWVVYAVAEPELDLSWSKSLSAGTAVFRTHNRSLRLSGDTVHTAGVANAGIVFLADVPAFGPDHARRQGAHERVHVIQEDHLSIMWTRPLGEWALHRVPALAGADRFVVVNLSTELLRLLGGAIPRHGDRPWELESIFLAR